MEKPVESSPREEISWLQESLDDVQSSLFHFIERDVVALMVSFNIALLLSNYHTILAFSIPLKMRKYRAIFRFTQIIGRSHQLQKGIMNILVPYRPYMIAPTKMKIDLSALGQFESEDLLVLDPLEDDDGR